MRIHTGSKPYKSSIGDKLYSTSTSLTAGHQIHAQYNIQTRKSSTSEIDGHENGMIRKKSNIGAVQDNPN